MNFSSSTNQSATTRRRFLERAGGGMGLLALHYLLAQSGVAVGAESAEKSSSNLPIKPHPKARAKSVIWLFMEGGPSHIDLFDPKPELERLAGQPLPNSFGKPITAMGTGGNTLMPSKRKWKQHGQAGLWISDWLPALTEHADDIAVLRSCYADGLNHVGSVCQMNTGDILAGRPSLGAWAQYGLGSSNQNLPAYVVLTDEGEVLGGPKNWSAGFLPGGFEGTHFRREGNPIVDLALPKQLTVEQQTRKLSLLRELNSGFSEGSKSRALDAQLESYELAFRMQSAAPEAVDLSRESALTHALYGTQDAVTGKFGRNCLLARRLVERGVRFVQCYCGSGSGWDAHDNLEANHSLMCKRADQPVAGLLTDLKARGLLDETLVVWGGEFGRTPFNEKGQGRDHNPWGFSLWMAGAGIKGGAVVGRTDELGLRAIEEKAHVHDIHATILHLLGLNHEGLTYRHNGRDERATINGGDVIEGLIA